MKKDKVLLEAVQLQATMMAGKQWKENSVSLNQRFEHSSLESRRKYFKLSQVFKWVYLLSHRLFFYSILTLTLDCFIHIVQHFAKTEAYYLSFFIVSVRLWNSLPNSFVNSPSVMSFKTNIKLYLSIN